MTYQESRESRNQERRRQRLFWLLASGFWLLGIMTIAAHSPKLPLSFFSPSSASAQTDDPYLLKDTAEQTGIAQPGAGDSLPQRVGELIGILLGFIGVVFFVLIVYAGIKWMTARGKEETTGEAKKIIENAVIGLIAISVAYALTSMIVGELLKP